MEHGESTWESNPPKKLLTPHTGFEDQEAHQHPFAPIRKIIHIKSVFVNLFMLFWSLNKGLKRPYSGLVISSLLSFLRAETHIIAPLRALMASLKG